eukprot:SAG31_NODE_9887_length_1215_cov_1.988351_1_plen_292_part_10
MILLTSLFWIGADAGLCAAAAQDLVSDLAVRSSAASACFEDDCAFDIVAQIGATTATQWFRFSADRGMYYEIAATTSAQASGRKVYWQLYDSSGQVRLAAADPTTLQHDDAATQRWFNDYNSGDFSLLVYSPDADSSNVELRIAAMDEDAASALSVPWGSLDHQVQPMLIHTHCRTAACTQTVTMVEDSPENGENEQTSGGADATLRFEAQAGRTYNFTLAMRQQKGVHLRATIIPSMATGNDDVWASPENRFSVSLGHWPARVGRAREDLTTTNDFVMEFDQEYPLRHNFA